VAATINQLFRHPETVRRAAQALQARGVAPEEISLAGGDAVGLLSGSVVSRPLPGPVPVGSRPAIGHPRGAPLPSPETTFVLSVATGRLPEAEVRQLLEAAAAAEGPEVRPDRPFDPNAPPAPGQVLDSELVSEDVPASRVNMQVADGGLGS
jgi:hypothetical protein